MTQVGAGTPMGELLRRYWMPIAAVAELDFDRVPNEMEPFTQDRIPYWYSPITE